LEWLGTSDEDDVASSSHHRAIEEKWILKTTCLTQLFFVFIQLKNMIALQKTSVVALDKSLIAFVLFFWEDVFIILKDSSVKSWDKEYLSCTKRI
jgi:hypothetical protein